MQNILKFLVIFVVLSLSTLASAQDSLRARLESRARETTTSDGMSVYRLRAEALEPYSHLSELAAPGTTEDQIDALNVGYVNYVCRIDGRRRIPPTRNGRFVDGGVEPTIDFATFAATQCEEGTASRELVAGAPYYIPREIVRTPAEELDEITASIAAASAADAPGVVDSTEEEARSLLRAGVPPASSASYATALTNVVSSLAARASTGAEMTFEEHETGDAPATVDSEALAAANARIAELTHERDEALRAQPRTWPYWIAIVILALLIVLVFFIRPKGGTIDLSDSQRKLERLDAKKALEKELGGTIPEIQKRLEKYRAYDIEATKAEGDRNGIQAVFQTVTGESRATADRIGEWMKKAKQALDFHALWMPVLDGLTPGELEDARSRAAKHRNLEEVWATTPGLKLVFAPGSLDTVIAAFLRFTGLQLKWSEELHPAFVLDTSSDGGLQAYVHARTTEATQELIRQRDGFEEQTNAQAELFRKERETNDGLKARLEEILSALNDVTRGEFGSILKRIGIERVVDAERVRTRFSKERKFEAPPKKKQKKDAGQEQKQNASPEKLVIHELLSLNLTDFLRKTHEGLQKANDLVCEALGRKAVVDHTPAPGSVAVPAPASLPVVTMPEGLGLEGSEEDPNAAEAKSGLGTDDLLDHPPEEETTERPSTVDQALADAALFQEAGGAEAATDGDDELESEPTFIGKAPLAPEKTHPFGNFPSQQPAEAKSSNGANGSHRQGEEVTQVVALESDGTLAQPRQRRNTYRGIAVAPPPVAEPAAAEATTPAPATDPPPNAE